MEFPVRDKIHRFRIGQYVPREESRDIDAFNGANSVDRKVFGRMRISFHGYEASLYKCREANVQVPGRDVAILKFNDCLPFLPVVTRA